MHIVGYLFYTSMVLNIAKILIDVKSQETNSRLIKSFNKHFCELNASNFILQVLFFTKLRDSKCMLYIKESTVNHQVNLQDILSLYI